jgi:uncharacterized protein (DUF362 family)/Pyruvate/2-oxoacid:ferredoxin oxidoreductase delta subunit
LSAHTPVAIIDCPDYRQDHVDAAVKAAADAAGAIAVSGAVVLVKPNMLNAAIPERAVTTHPAVVLAVIRWLKQHGAARVLVGDAPAWQPMDSVGTTTGIMQAAKSAGAEWADFTVGVSVAVPDSRLVRRFEIARPVVEADLVISLPKLKTHGLMYYTGAVKNLFGAVPGFKKSAFHLRFPGRSEFAAMLADLMLAVKPGFAIMDAVTGMEGPGPNAGTPRQVGLILASPDCWALDWVAAGLIGYNPAEVPYLGLAATDQRYGFDPDAIRTCGEDPAKRTIKHYHRIKVLKDTDLFRRRMPGWLHRIVRNATVARPEFSDDRCIRCAGCIRICPAGALSLTPAHRAPTIDYSACIRCYCCHEICPEDAISLHRRLF